MQACIDFAFTVFPEPAAFFEPSERAFDDPAFGDDGEGVEFSAFRDLDGSHKNALDS